MFSTNASAKKTKITVHRAHSLDGMHYKTVDEVHENHLFYNEASLSCEGPGHVFCGWNNPPKIGDGTVTTKEIESYVSKRISDGDNSGSVNYDGKAYVKWQYNPDRDDLVITIDDDVKGTPLPEL